MLFQHEFTKEFAILGVAINLKMLEKLIAKDVLSSADARDILSSAAGLIATVQTEWRSGRSCSSTMSSCLCFPKVASNRAASKSGLVFAI